MNDVSLFDGYKNEKIDLLINWLNNKYKHYGISLYEIKKIVYSNLTGDKFNYKEIKDKTDKEIFNMISESLSMEEYLYHMLYAYIKENFENGENFDVQLNNLKGLSNLLINFSLIPCKRIIEKLILNNKKFNTTCDVVTKNSAECDSIDDELIFLIIEVYRDMQNITSSTLKDNPQVKASPALEVYLREIGKINSLSSEEEKELIKKVKQGDEIAYKKFVESNLKLVVFIAKRYYHMKFNSLSYEDLISEGNIGLLRAIDKYDPSKGFKFSTYASWWIKQAIMAAIREKGKAIKVPTHYNNIITRFKMVESNLESKLGRKVTTRELASELGITEKELNRIYSYSHDIKSLNEKIGDDTEFGDLLKVEVDYYHEIEKKELKNILINFISNSKLTKNEKKVILLRFGLYDGDKWKLSDVAKELNISRQRASQLELKGIEKLSTTVNKKRLKAVLDNVPYIRVKKEVASTNERCQRYVKFKSLYKYLGNCDRFYIDIVISTLSDDEITILRYVYGDDYSQESSKENVPYSIIIKFNELMEKMRRQLADIGVEESLDEEIKYIDGYDNNNLLFKKM